MVRLFDMPDYMAFCVNKKRDSLIVYPCESNDALAFKVPKNLFGKNGRQFKITSKPFIHELIVKNGLSGKTM